MSNSRVAVTIVTFNSGRYIAGCLESVLAQTHELITISVVDNASSDSTGEILRSFETRDGIRVAYNRRNTGFAAGQNQAMAEAADADWVLTLNPDVRLAPSFTEALLMASEMAARIGSVCGKLLACSPDFEVASPPLLDSTGVYFTPELRHLDRGSRIPDRGQYEVPQFVFGGTGAACLYRQEMIRDISISGEFFDSDFFVYREDADVAWRAQLRGWKALYTPAAVGYHVRAVVPENRRDLPAIINMHSVKNRWLLRIKNTTPDLYRRYWLPITLRDAVVIGGCLLGEWNSLAAFPLVVKLWRKTWSKRREIMNRKRAEDAYIARWFSRDPAAESVVTER